MLGWESVERPTVDILLGLLEEFDLPYFPLRQWCLGFEVGMFLPQSVFSLPSG